VFLGRFLHTVDSKGRVTIPAKFRPNLAGGVVVTRGIDRCLYIYPQAEWDRLAERVRELPLTKKDARSFVRFLFSEASDCVPDRQGRILIPGYLREYANLDSEIVIAGLDNRLEMWSSSAWHDDNSDLEKDAQTLAEKLGELGIL